MTQFRFKFGNLFVKNTRCNRWLCLRFLLQVYQINMSPFILKLV